MNIQKNNTLELLKLFSSYMVVFIHVPFGGKVAGTLLLGEFPHSRHGYFHRVLGNAFLLDHILHRRTYKINVLCKR